MGKVDGVVVGIVKGLDDPKKLGRVEVHFPWMSDNNRSYWARPATLMAGPDRGAWFQPELDDEVLVAFEHGSSQHPYIVGFLWNGQDKPPTKKNGIDGKVRRIKSVAGHVLDFDDRDGKNAVRIETAAGHKLTIDDANSKITIETKTNQKIEIDGNGQSILLDNGTQVSVKLDPTGITLDAKAGIVAINCMQLKITATAMMQATAPMSQFAGLVQTPTLTAGTVSGAAYTPAPGNTLGL